MGDQGSFFPSPEPVSRGALLPSATCEWATPQDLFDLLDEEFGFTVDVAATAENAKCERFYTKEQNGLAQSWRGERVWCNPPYDVRNLEAFSAKALHHATEDPDFVAALLVPVKTDQRWWHTVAINSEVRFIRGRVAFGGCGCTAPMPVCVVIVSQRHEAKMVSMEGRQMELEMGDG